MKRIHNYVYLCIQSKTVKIPQKFQDCLGNDALLESQRKRQAELIHQLKGQLEELESYAYESGEGNMPSNILLERQRVVMGKIVMCNLG